ncbi:MAG TPA: VOC family protein [Solimonas sp.]|nr:VOC family protein [Solimonas sp.]
MRHLYPIITTPDLAQCRKFYVEAFGARVLFQEDWYVHLSIAGWEIGFLHPSHPTRLPVFQHTTPTRGVCIALEVEDVRTLYQELLNKGIEPLGQPGQHPGGELSFSVMDPSGVVLNVVERRADVGDLFGS